MVRDRVPDPVASAPLNRGDSGYTGLGERRGLRGANLDFLPGATVDDGNEGEIEMDIAGFLNFVLTVLTFLLIGRALLSWFDPQMRTPIGKLLFDITEPLVAPVRRVIPSAGMFDLSIMVTLLLLYVLRVMIGTALSG